MNNEQLLNIHLSHTHTLSLSSIYLLSSIIIYYSSLSIIHLTPIQHRSGQAEHPLMAALRARRVAMHGAHSRRKGVLCLPTADLPD
jgi:hypothetical protein